MLNFNSLCKRKDALEKELIALRKFLDTAPKGSLITRRKANDKYDYFQYIQESNGKKKEKYIPQSKISMAEKLALKTYAEKRVCDCRQELQVIDDFLLFYGNDKRSDSFLKKHPGAGKLIIPHLKSQDVYAKQWHEKEYIRSNYRPEDLIYSTVDPNLKVRSKAESDIISRLVFFHVPYRYEEQIIFNGIVIHPDLTCLNIRTQQEYYWEHQGGWDQQDYVLKLSGREDLYRSAGIIPWKNLIITTETANQPLDINWVDTIIEYYLL